ncbi:MAG: dihydropteroate synthase [Chitinophagaceae bacterium]
MFTLNCNGRLLVVDKPMVMGIINVTPDSFYEGSRFYDVDGIIAQAEKMLVEGANFLDVGAQSTRPGNEQVGAEEELRRLVPAIESLHANFPAAIISVDTYYARVAESAVAVGAAMVNDISGGNADLAMLATVASLRVPYVCMHIKGIPETMHVRTNYENITREILDFFITKIELCRLAGIHDVIIDPGFGFSKNSSQNFELLKNLSVLSILGNPLLVGLSRKSTIYKTLGVTAAEALNGTTVLNTISLLNGATILRVHDVKEAVETIKLVTELGIRN